MEEVIVLGQVPSTSVQITFSAWAAIVLSLIFTVFFIKLGTHYYAKVRAHIYGKQATKLLKNL